MCINLRKRYANLKNKQSINTKYYLIRKKKKNFNLKKKYHKIK